MTRSPNYQKERGLRQEARILALLAESPQTTRQLAEALHMTTSSVFIYLKRLRQDRVSIYDFTIPTGKGREAPIFALGKFPDAVYEPTSLRKPKSAESRIVTQERRVIAALAVPMTAEQLGIAVCLSTSRARIYVSRLRALKQAYIKAWAAPKGQGDIAPIYALGKRGDAPKPRQSRASRYAAEMKDPDKRERRTSQRRTRHMLDKAAKKPQNPFSALGL